MPECAKSDCDKTAIGDKPRLCAQHFLEFVAILNGVREARLARDGGPHDD